MSVKKPDPYALDGGEARPNAAKEGAGPDVEPEAAPVDAPSASGHRLFTSDVVTGVHLIRPSDARLLDAQHIERLGDEIYHLLKPVDAPRVVIDLDAVEHMSSAALGMLVALRTVVEKRGGKVCLAHVRPELQQVFKITKLHKILKIHDDSAKAVASLG
jgi:anti-sigma B factor antagonist